MSALDNVYGNNLIVRPPVPATCNKAGANYKSEVKHLEYAPRRAFDEWLTICEGIVACGGDAIYQFEAADEPFLDCASLRIDGDGKIYRDAETSPVGSLDAVETGRVFTANGPWVTVADNTVRAVMPNMLAHRKSEAPYYRGLLETLATASGTGLEIRDNPHPWEGMADVAVVGDKVVLTHTVAGHYDEGVGPKTSRSTRDGVAFAADHAGVPEAARIYVELVYPHFHGDTVHFGGRPTNRGPVLIHYAGGLWGDGAAIVAHALGAEQIVPIGKDDAVTEYAGNSRQVGNGVLVPDGASTAFSDAMVALGLEVVRVPLFELFGKAGGGPACATLYLPKNLSIPTTLPQRYSVSRTAARARRERIPEKLFVDPGYFAGRARG